MKPAYWKGCPSMHRHLDCTLVKDHKTLRHSFLGEVFWQDGDEQPAAVEP